MGFTRQGSALEINHSTTEVVGVKEVMETESEIGERAQISLKLILLALFGNLELVESSVHNDREQTIVI